MPIFEIETDQGVFEIDADREPTQAEALQAISGQAQVDPVQQVDPTPAFIPETPLQASQRASLTLPKALADIITGTVELGAEGVGGLVDILRKGSTDTGPTSVSEAIGEAILGSAMGPLGGRFLTTGQQRRDIAQTGLEAAPRAALELGAALRQPIEFAAEEPMEAARRVIELNPLVAAIAAAVSPREALTPEQQDLAQQRAGRQEATARALEQAIVPEIIGEANIPLARAAPLLIGAEAPVAATTNLARRGLSRIGTMAETVGSRGIISKPLEDVITRTTGITASEGSLEAAPIVKTRISEWPGKPPNTAKEFIDVANKAQSSVLQDALAPLRAAEKEGLVMKGNSMIENGREAVLRDFPSLANDAQAVQSVIDEFAYLRGDLKPTQGQGFLRELNRRYNGLENKNSPTASAYRAVRNELSNQTDEIIKAQTGKDASPYRDWGQIEDFKNGVQEQITTAQRVQAGRAEPSVSAGGIPTTTRGVAARAARSLPVGRAFIPREIEAIDKGVRRIFKDVKSVPKAADLGEDAVNALRTKYQPGATPPTIPVSLEDQIQRLIQSYPANVRSNASLARAVAEAELAGQSTPLSP